jgi:hypothetical protein
MPVRPLGAWHFWLANNGLYLFLTLFLLQIYFTWQIKRYLFSGRFFSVASYIANYLFSLISIFLAVVIILPLTKLKIDLDRVRDVSRACQAESDNWYDFQYQRSPDQLLSSFKAGASTLTQDINAKADMISLTLSGFSQTKPARLSIGEEFGEYFEQELIAAPGVPIRIVLFSANQEGSSRDYITSLRRMVTRLRRKPGAVLLIADLKASPFSRGYQLIERGAKLQDVRRGAGVFSPLFSPKNYSLLSNIHVFARDVKFSSLPQISKKNRALNITFQAKIMSCIIRNDLSRCE